MAALKCCDILHFRPSVWMPTVMRLSDKTCTHLRGPLRLPRRPSLMRDAVVLMLPVIAPSLLLHLSSLPLPSVHLNCRHTSSWWQDKTECTYQHRLPSSWVPLFDQLIKESNQPLRWKKAMCFSLKIISLLFCDLKESFFIVIQALIFRGSSWHKILVKL